MTNQVIELPKQHTLKKRLRDRVHDQKAAMILSIASVLVVTLVVNQWISTNSSSLNQNERGIASLQPSDIRRNIQWEHELAQQLSVEKGLSQATLAERPTLRDELVFGALQGRYGVKLSGGLVQSLEFLESQNGEEPLKVNEAMAFLKKYRTIWSKSFSDARPRDLQADQETYQLLDDKMTLVGQARIKKDARGRLMSLDFVAQ